MKCVICKNGTTVDGKTNVLFEVNGIIIVVRNVPARVCNNCGESYVSEDTTESLLEIVDQAKKSGIQMEIRNYIAA